jgi:glycosyltransferase involved in cell wall biosynthesis
MKLSVSLITYNHEKYISKAIESILMQKTDFDFEIVIGEDDSTDGTREIVKEYKRRYPDKIRLYLNERKNVIYIDGKPTGRWNFINNLNNCTGEYVALLEGDDYWTDPYKLQRQVNYLDDHPDCTLCFHDVKCINEETNQTWIFYPRKQKEVYKLIDILKGNFMHTCSVVFRRGLFGDFPDWFYRVPVGDWPLHILNAQYGDIGYIKEVMGVYRMHVGGRWSAKEELHRWEDTIKVYKIMNAHFNYHYNWVLKKRIFDYYIKIIEKKVGLFLKEHGFHGVVNIYRKIFYPDSTPK